MPILHAWGMTETSPLGLDQRPVQRVRRAVRGGGGGRAGPAGHRRRSGWTPGSSSPGTLTELPWDDKATGELQVRGPWIAGRLLRRRALARTRSPPDGWLRTGDVGAIDRHGNIRLSDRTKDLVKSGGEWISSVELENHLMAHPAVAEAAVIGVPHPKLAGAAAGAAWCSSRASRRPRRSCSSSSTPRVAKWWLPDDVVFIDEVPKTSVGKFSKKDLRARFADYELPGDQLAPPARRAGRTPQGR